MRRARWGILLCALAPVGCGLGLDEPVGVIHARFDPEAKVIPMPSDILRDEVAGTLDIPIDDDLTAAERYLYEHLNQMDGWSSASAAVVDLDGAVETATVTPDTLEVWRWGLTPARVADATIHVAADGRSITIDAPRTGWDRGATYAVVMRGGEAGVRGAAGERVECDAAFYFLRLEERLDTPEHERAFPGDSPEERRDNAAKLEEIRTDLAPFFDFFANRDLPRAEIAALWTFTVTRRVELAMDKASQRMPIPIDLLLDPATGKVDLPPASWDSETVRYAKERLAEFDGFATSANLLFQLTGPVDPATVSDDLVELWSLGGAAPERVPVSIALLADHAAIEVTPTGAPLDEAAGYAIAVKQGLLAADGTGPVALMPAGHLMLADAPVADGDGASLVDPVADEDAIRIERVRAATGGFLGRRGRDDLLSAWSFTTMTITPPLQAAMASAESLAIPPEPSITQRQSAGQAIADFALAIGSLWDVDEVVHGTIRSPVFLGRDTRAWRADGGHEVDDIAFTAIIPEDLPPGAPVPVVIFGHAIMTERRMVLALGDALASRGIAAVAIDLPFHGTRTYCWSEGPLTIPDPTTGELTEIASPCAGDAVCREDGRCVGDDGSPAALREWPVLPMPMASGAAFLEIAKIANSRDHFRQAEIDLASLARSLRAADWSPVFGRPVDTDRVFYAGQSLGGILGATFTALEPTVSDAVLNVPGADTVDMFVDSPFFGRQIDAFFKREGVEPASFEGHRFLNVARWFMDSVDPASFASRLVANPDGPGPRRVLLQMATLDFIIPNPYTETLQALSGARRRDYIAEHGFLVIPVEPEYWRGTSDLAKFLTGDDL
ncbi:MAG TPA: hypothetical protein VIG06_09075 [Kofleriaceae bacterium]|jgi:dienelactone hydrolase